MTFKTSINGQEKTIEINPIERHAVLSHLWKQVTDKNTTAKRREAFDKAHLLMACLFNGVVED